MNKLDSLIRNLDEKKGTDIHQSIAEALETLGFKSECIIETDVEPDIIAKSYFPKYALVIESSIHENKSVPSKKTVQIRQNGARHKHMLAEEGFRKVYYIIIGKPYFSKKIEKVSDPDICLVTISELIDLIKTHQKYQFTLEDMESIFLNPGKASNQITYIFNKYKKPYLICGFLLDEINEKLKITQKISINELKTAVKLLFNLLLTNYTINDTEIEESILLLTNNMVNLFSIQIEGNIHFLIRKGHEMELHLPRILGNTGERIIEAYQYCKELKSKIKDQEKKDF